MTQEEKQLLLQDLCARSSYGVICRITNRDSNYKLVEIDCANYSLSFVSCILPYSGYQTSVVDVELNAVKPYLRPMSSMTEEEENEWHGLNIDPLFEAVGEQHTRIEDLMLRAKSQYNPVDWLNAHHFDYRGLIEKGLAIAVTEDNNPYKQ